MINEYVDGMKEIKASDELKNRIVRSVKQEDYERPRYFSTLRKTVVFIAFIFIMTFCIAFIQNNIHITEQGEIKDKTAILDSFIITAYASDGTDIEVKPDVEFPLGKYQATMSSVPGFPIRIVCNNADVIKLSATDGELLLWNYSDSKAHNMGKEVDIKSGDMIYWSPLNGADMKTIATSCTLMIKGYRNQKQLCSNSINIKANDKYVYTGKLLK